MKKSLLIILSVLLMLLLAGCYDRTDVKGMQKAEQQHKIEVAYEDGYEDGYSDGCLFMDRASTYLEHAREIIQSTEVNDDQQLAETFDMLLDDICSALTMLEHDS